MTYENISGKPSLIGKTRKIFCLIFMLVVSAGIIFLSCAFTVKLPKDVEVNGICVGGMGRREAAALIREGFEKELKGKTLEVRAGAKKYSFTYPEIYFKDDIYTLLKNARKGDRLTANVSYYLCGLNVIARDICAVESVSVVEPYAKFSAFSIPFTYFEGSDGKRADEGRLIEDIKKSLSAGFENGVDFEAVTVKFNEVKRSKSMAEVKKSTRLLSTFTTNFDGSNLPRTSNIRLAADKLNGSIIEAGKTLSFNDIVGARVKERGFLPAKIIENGEFTEGVGGGVCQVSTTLYNAALLSGMKIKEYHPHSLSVGYVPPSRDAMVSGSYFDLKITNPYDCPLYIRALTQNNSVTFKIYGYDDGARFSLSSEVTGTLPAPEEVCDSPEKAKAGKDGLTSAGYLTVTRGGKTEIRLLRKDRYSPVKRVVYPDPAGAENTDEDGQNAPVTDAENAPENGKENNS